MKTRFVAYDRLGARRGVLTHILQAEVVPSKNELPTLTLTYPRSQPTHKWLLNSPEVAFEYLDNDEWVEPKNARFKMVTQDFDYLEEVETRNYSFIGIGEGIRGIYVFDGNGLNVTEEGKVQFVASTPGKMLNHVWTHAVQRGWKGFSKSFSATADSSGRPWTTSMNLTFDRDTSLDGMVNYFSRMGLIDFEWEGRTLHIYNADTTMARDISTGNNPMKFNLSGGRASVDAAPESNDHENLASHVIVTGENGLRWVFPTNAKVPEGRREVFLNYSGVDDEGTALILARPTIAKYSNSLKNTTRQFQIGPSTLEFPYIDYRIGDWVLVEKDDAVWERVQIFQMALLINQNGVQGYVSLGDKIDSLLEKLNEAVQRVQGGSINEGTEPPAKSSVQPTPPKGLIVSSTVLADTFGQMQTVVAVNFTHDGKAVDGRLVNVNRYEVHYRPDGGAWSHLFMVQPPSQAGSYSWLPAKKPNGEPAVYNFVVYAISDKAQWSKPSSIVSHTVRQDEVAPSKPQPPKVKGEFGVFTATVTHLRHDGQALEADYSFTVIEMGTSAAGPWTDATTIQRPQKDGYIPAEGYHIRWFRAVAVDIEGNRSEPSSSVSAETKPLVNGDLIISEIDAGKTRIINAGKIIMENGTELIKRLADADKAISDTNASLTGPGGLTERLTGAEAKLNNVGDLMLTAGQTLKQKLAASDKAITDTTASLTNLKNVVIPALDDSLGAAEDRLIVAEKDILAAEVDITAARSDLTKITTRVGTVESGMNTLNNTTLPNLTKSINGKTTINRQTTVAANPGSYSLGDRWEQWDKLTAGGKLLKTWRHNGTAWIEEILAASYLPLVDIGAGTFGTLEGGRLTANSVSTKHLLVGSFSNLLENGSFDFGTTSWGGFPTGWSIDPAAGRNGTAGLKCTGVTERVFGPTSAINIPLEYGDSYRVSGWVKTNATTNPTRGEICLYYYRADGSFFGNQNFNIDKATADWQQFSGILTPNNSEAAYFRVRLNATLSHASQEYCFDDIAVVKASNGSLIVNGTITGEHVDAKTVGAEVGAFVKADIGNLVVTGSSKLTDVVAKRVAADTASFQTVDAKNIFVTGTASLNEVVAKRFAADTGEFLTLGVDQLTVTGNANMKEVVADKVFANLFSTRKLYSESVVIGQMGNAIPDPLFTDVEYVRRVNAYSTATVALSSSDDLAITGTAATSYFRPLGQPQNTSGFKEWIPVKPGQKWRFELEMASVRLAGGYITIIGRTQDGQAYSNPTEKTSLLVGNGKYSVEVEIPATCYWIMPEMGVPANSGTIYVKRGSMVVREMITPELLVDGAVTARTIQASEEMSAKIGQFLKLNVVDLVTSGSAKINEAVITKLFTETFATHKLTANQVYIGEGGNLFPADMNDEAWQRQYSITFAATGGKTSGTSMLIPAGATQMGTYFGISDVTERERMPKLVAGQKYRVRANIMSSGTIPKGGAAIYLRLYGPTKTDYVWVPGSSITNAAGVAASTWGEVDGIFEVPEASVNLYLGVGLYSQVAHTGNLRWSDLILQEAITPELIVDGAITTKKLTITEEMVAELFKVQKVEAVHIDFNSLFGDSGFIGNLRTTVLTSNSIDSTMIKGDAINAKHTLTGPTVQTTSAANRGVKLNLAGIKAWDANGLETLRVDAATGEVVATGAFLATGAENTSLLLTSGGYKGAAANRPRVIFDTDLGNNKSLEPSIFGIGRSGFNGYKPGALIVNGYEQTANSSGRSALTIGPGTQWALRNEWGPYSQMGIEAIDDTLRIMGKNVHTQNGLLYSIITGFGQMGSHAAASITWKVANPYPQTSGKWRPVITPDSFIPVMVSVNYVYNTGFNITAWSMHGTGGEVGLYINAIWGG